MFRNYVYFILHLLKRNIHIVYRRTATIDEIFMNVLIRKCSIFATDRISFILSSWTLTVSPFKQKKAGRSQIDWTQLVPLVEDLDESYAL